LPYPKWISAWIRKGRGCRGTKSKAKTIDKQLLEIKIIIIIIIINKINAQLRKILLTIISLIRKKNIKTRKKIY
jgi:hypothetical protein